jgi:pimeloyl-ACP methyl ester carboxylesterase
MHLTVASLLTLAAVLLTVGLALCAAIVYLLADSLIKPPRMTDGKAAWVLKRLSPGDLQLPFEEVDFSIRDAGSGAPLRIAAWWIPHPDARGRCAVFIHGYADAKVGSIAWAQTWHALGYNVLAIDLRAHGESGGRFCTGGYLERDDVVQVIDLLCARKPEESRQDVLFGASFGAAVAVAAADLLNDRPEIAGVVLDSPVPDFTEAAMLQMDVLGAPDGLLRRLAVRLAERRSGARYAKVRLLDLLPKLRSPAMLIVPQLDRLYRNGEAERLREICEASPSNTFWHVAGVDHLLALPGDPDGYRDRLARFLNEADRSGRG